MNSFWDIRNPENRSWACWGPINVLGLPCVIVQGQEYMDAAYDYSMAQVEAQTAQQNAVEAAAKAGIAESVKNQAVDQLMTSFLTVLPIGLALGTVGLGFVGYMWWRSRNR